MSRDSFTFLHAADLHIDSPLRGLGRYEGAPADRFRAATRGAFANLVDAALERAVDFLVIAGDVFDGEWPDYGSGLWFTGQLQRLGRAGIPVVLLRGNHDAESRVAKKLRLPEHVHELSTKEPETLRLEGLDVALHGQGFPDARVQENLARTYPEAVPGVFNIGVLHTSLEGDRAHKTYAPCSLDDLRAKGYDYWALGHIHQRRVVSEAAPCVVFSGNLQGRHVRELGPKSATLVRVEDGQLAGLEEVTCDVARWAHATVDVTSAESVDQILALVQAALDGAAAESSGLPVAARVTITGATECDVELRQDARRIENEVRALGLGVQGDLWVEKVVVATTPQGADSTVGSADDGLEPLVRSIQDAELAPADIAALVDSCNGLATKLTRVIGAPDVTSTDAFTARVDGARSLLLALLSGPELAADEDSAP